MFVLPIYFNETKSRVVLASQNKYRNWHHYTQNKFKKEFSEILVPQLANLKPYKGCYSVTYTLYYKNPTCDLTNICSLSSKVFNDCLQYKGLVENDNVQWLKEERFIVGGQDKINPRVEIICKAYKP